MIRDHMIEYCHVPADRIRLVYNGVDTERFRPPTGEASSARLAMRAKLGVRQETLFLHVAHNFQLKGLDTVLRSLARLVATEPAVKLVVATGIWEECC